MNLKPGMMIWIPCEVKPGPSSNERSVKIGSSEEAWIGFVDVQYLKDPVEQGSTFIRALVVDVETDRYRARLPGHSVGSRKMFQGNAGTVTLAPVPA